MSIVIIEGGELSGKTSVVRALQDLVPYHTLIKLSGYPTSLIPDIDKRSNKIARQYQLIDLMMEHFSEDERLLVFDRFATTERVMFPQSFLRGNLMQYLQYADGYNAKQFILTAPTDILKARYNERRTINNLERQSFSTILEVHERYRAEVNISPIETHIISNDGSYSAREIAESIIRLANIKLYPIND